MKVRGIGSFWGGDGLWVGVCRAIFLFLSSITFSNVGFSLDRFDDIEIIPQTFPVGESNHGYIENRFLIWNHSPREAHLVRIVLQSYRRGGHYLRRVDRSITVGEGSMGSLSIMVPRLQFESVDTEVYVDNKKVGRLQHQAPERFPYNNYGSGKERSILVSREFVKKEVEDILNQRVHSDFFSPLMATGSPEGHSNTHYFNERGVKGRRNVTSSAWTPAHRHGGQAWIVLSYRKAVKAKSVNIYLSEYSAFVKEILCFDENSSPVKITRLKRNRNGRLLKFSFNTTSVPVSKVKLVIDTSKNFEYTGIDAVQLVGDDNLTLWASGAIASSSLKVPAKDLSLISRYGGYSNNEVNYHVARPEIPTDEWSGDWLSYSAYEGVVIMASEMSQVPEVVVRALWQYAELGGTLVIVGEAVVPAPWRDSGSPNIYWDVNGKQVDEEFQRYSVGFGNCLVIDKASVKEFSRSDIVSIIASFQETTKPWQNLPGEREAERKFSVVGEIKQPLGLMTILMLGFILLIGPVNIIVLNRMNRRVWLLWTLPAISMAMTAIVFVYSYFSEGVTGRGRVGSLTVLDQVNKRASSLGMAAYYCPITPRGGLTFGYDTEVTPILKSNSYGYDNGGESREMSWDGGQHLSSGWVQARVPSYFYLRKSETRRERIELLRKSEQELAIVNGLGARVENLWLADASGKVYAAEKIDAGKQVALSETEWKVSDEGFDSFLKTRYTSRAWVPLRKRNKDAESWIEAEHREFISKLRSGSYIAFLDENPFVEKGLSGRAKFRERCVVIGILEREAEL